MRFVSSEPPAAARILCFDIACLVVTACVYCSLYRFILGFLLRFEHCLEKAVNQSDGLVSFDAPPTSSVYALRT